MYHQKSAYAFAMCSGRSLNHTRQNGFAPDEYPGVVNRRCTRL
jgi:hypothetical protein